TTPECRLLQKRQQHSTQLLDTTAGGICLYETTALDISATNLRRQMAQGISPRFLLPDAVRAYIEEHELYRDRKAEPAND
ncbi:MAG: hypothetical protein ACOY7J_22130, partial [Pseudomonadota bacterium]